MASVMMIAAEASSALFAQRLLEYWKAQNKVVDAFGVGTVQMENLGFRRFGEAEKMAVVGLAEIAEHYSDIKAVFNRLVQEAKDHKPDLVVLIDYPEFNLRLAKEMHALGIPVIYYVSPQVWAWRQGRIKQIKAYCSKVLLLFPFEIPFYEKHQVPFEFVGHPLLDELDPKFNDEKFIQVRRTQCGIKSEDFVLGLMPGSRHSEIKYNFPTQLEVARRLLRKHPHLRVVIMVAPTRTKEDLLPYLEDVRFSYQLLQDEPMNMICLTDMVLVTSGTATLVVGLLQKPMVIMYKVNWLTALIGKMIVTGFFGLVNLILGKQAVPERFQEKASPDHLFELMDRYVVDKSYRQQVIDDLKQIPSRLGNPGATKRVSAILERYLQ